MSTSPSLAPTLIGEVGGVSGATISIRLSTIIKSGIAVIEGDTYKVGQVGSFVRIPQGYQNLYGIVAEVGANAVPDNLDDDSEFYGRWIRAQLVGETIGDTFERGISQFPNVGDEVHLVTQSDLVKIYGQPSPSHITIGRLSSAENIPVRLDIDKIVSRHCAILGSTGSGKSTTVASFVRSIVDPEPGEKSYPNARVVMMDIHGEYSRAFSDIATVFKVDPESGTNQQKLHIPFWALEATDIVNFLTGGISDNQLVAVFDRILEFKKNVTKTPGFLGLSEAALTVDTPVPFSLHQLWYDLIDWETRTFKDNQRTELYKNADGDSKTLTPPDYEPATSTNQAPFLNQKALGIRRQLDTMKSRMLDHRYDFMLHPGPWEPDLAGKSKSDLDELLKGWLGHSKSITVLDLSGIPDDILHVLVGAILKIIFEAMFWARKKPEGSIQRPLLIIMEEAHRYLSSPAGGLAKAMAQRIVKEGRKYGIGAMVISQRPSEVDDTILSQCGTHVALRLSNQTDRARVQGTIPDSLGNLTDMLPILRTGEAIVMGEAAHLPIRCRIWLPSQERRPDSEDPKVSEKWSVDRGPEDYGQVVASWRGKTAVKIETSNKSDKVKAKSKKN